MEIILIFAFTIAIYFRTIFYSIIVDDIKVYNNIITYMRLWNPKRGDKTLPKTLKTMVKEFFRELGTRTYGGGTFGPHPWLDHMLCIYTTACLGALIYMVFGYNQISFFAALLYVANPANHQASMWLNGRRYAISAILVMLMMLFKPFGIVFYPCTFFWNHALAFFAPILYMDIAPWLPLLIVPVFLWKRKELCVRIKARMDRILCKEQRVFGPARIIIIVKSFGFYFFNMLAPGRVLINNPSLYWWGITKEKNDQCYSFNLEFLKGLIAVGLSAFLMFYFTGYMRIMWVFTVLSILQWSAITSSVQINADRYMAVPIVFMMFFLSHLINMLPFSGYVYVGIVVYYVTQLHVCMVMYKTIDWYQRYQMFYAPQIAKPRFNRIDFYFKQGRFLTAWYLIEEGLQNMPNDFLLLYQAGVALSQIGNLKQAIEFIDQAEKNMYLGQEVEQKRILDDLRTKITNRRIDIERTKKQEIKKANRHGGKKKR
ncbi:hypothetical protein [Sulfuricurvum sp.]|uniref:hypothetical protein n=1 Tax=Sulfuricurvum sp. TaxID=2025608 RepID=UPI0035664A0D